MSDIVEYPVTPEDAKWLFEHFMLTEFDIKNVPNEPNMRQISEKAWEKIPLGYRPCTWCGKIMDFQTDPNTKDTCMDCTSPEGL